MKKSENYIINVFAAGFFTLVLLSVLLFWGRKVVQIWTHELQKDETIKIQPSGLLPQLDAEPNIVQQSCLTISKHDEAGFLSLGIVQDCFQEEYGSIRYATNGDSYNRWEIGKLYYLDNTNAEKSVCIYFDEDIKKFVCCLIRKEIVSGESKWVKLIHFYAGPDGVSADSDAETGQFSGSFIAGLRDGRKITIYDKNLRRFFQIDFDGKIVTKGAELDENYHPLQIDYSEVSSPGLRLYWQPSSKKQSAIPVSGTLGFCSYHIVLDESGWIYLLNPDTLALGKHMGFLLPPPPFNNKAIARPDDLFAYSVVPVSQGNKYAGMAVGSISREGTGLAVSVFDPNGNPINHQTAWYSPEKHPGGPLLMFICYILENLQAPLLGIGSHLTESRFEAVAGHRALFVLPESFVGWFGRENSEAPAIVKFLGALFIISPSIILSLFLARSVRKNCITVGISAKARRWWFWGTVALGLSAYITYRLTRPKATLVTCVNCGKPRRPDMDNCHHCGSGWIVPELIAPNWRVVDN